MENRGNTDQRSNQKVEPLLTPNIFMMNMDPGPHDKMHWNCCWKPWGGKILWWASFLALIGGLIAFWRGGEFYGVSAMTWYWNALVGGVLALGLKVSKFHSCWHQSR